MPRAGTRFQFYVFWSLPLCLVPSLADLSEGGGNQDSALEYRKVHWVRCTLQWETSGKTVPLRAALQDDCSLGTGEDGLSSEEEVFKEAG